MMKKPVVVFLFLMIGYVLLINVIRPYWLTQWYINSESYQTNVQAWKLLELNSKSSVFIGNSLMKSFDITSFGEDAKKMAVGGDVLDGLEIRLSMLCEAKPKSIVINMGINDVIHGFGFDISKLQKFINGLRDCSPHTELFIMSLGPENLEKGFFTNPERIGLEIKEANAQLVAYCKAEWLQFVDVYDELSLNGKLKDTYSADGLHLTQSGYDVWERELKKFLDQ